MKKVLLYIWQLPQNILGLILLGYYKLRGDLRDWPPFKDPSIYLSKYMTSGISLGNYIIFRSKNYLHFPTATDIGHEYGHCKQSRMLGPLYLLIIGIPSALGNVWDVSMHGNWPNNRRREWYYNQPWEKWADKLGDVQR